MTMTTRRRCLVWLVALAAGSPVAGLCTVQSSRGAGRLGVRRGAAPAEGWTRRAVLGETAIASAAAAAAATASLGGPPPAVAVAPAVAVPTTALGSLQVSRTIQGYWQLAGGHGAYTEQEAVRNMAAHLAAGMTTLDTADIYGPSESIVGKFVAEEARAVPCTKFCCFRNLQGIDKTEVRARVLKQIARLQVDSLPLVAFFWADYGVKRYADVALMLTELREEGLIKEIGVTNFDTKRLRELKDAGVPVVSNQVEFSLLDQRPERSGMREYCVDNGVKLIAFGTVGAGLLSEAYLGKPPPTREQLEAGGFSLKKYIGTASRAGTWDYTQSLLVLLDSIAKKHSVSIANVAQRYLLDLQGVASVLIGVRNQKHIKDNVRTHSFSLDEDDRAAIRDLIRTAKGPVGDVWDIERGYV